MLISKKDQEGDSKLTFKLRRVCAYAREEATPSAVGEFLSCRNAACVDGCQSAKKRVGRKIEAHRKRGKCYPEANAMRRGMRVSVMSGHLLCQDEIRIGPDWRKGCGCARGPRGCRGKRTRPDPFPRSPRGGSLTQAPPSGLAKRARRGACGSGQFFGVSGSGFCAINK